jgi:hypothetical protein
MKYFASAITPFALLAALASAAAVRDTVKVPAGSLPSCSILLISADSYFQYALLVQRPSSTQPRSMASHSRMVPAGQTILSSRLATWSPRMLCPSATSTSAAHLAPHTATAVPVDLIPMVSYLYLSPFSVPKKKILLTILFNTRLLRPRERHCEQRSRRNYPHPWRDLLHLTR